MRVVLFALGFLLSHLVIGQPVSYLCQSAGYEFFSNLVGTWQVVAKDRTSPGNYESNNGIAVISSGIQGCSINESYQGTFKGKAYAISATLLLTDSMKVQRSYFDSEHANIMLFDGEIVSDGIRLFWYRNKSNPKMQVRYDLVWSNKDAFEWTTHLSTDFGDSWQLTHHWKYQRMVASSEDQAEYLLIENTLNDYHQGLTTGNIEMVLNAISRHFIMFNGNYSGDALNWQAHLYLSGSDLTSWPSWFIAEAGPYQNNIEILTVHTRANAAVVVSRDTGSNKFRQWNKEQTTWLLGKEDGQYKILAYFLRNISNP